MEQILPQYNEFSRNIFHTSKTDSKMNGTLGICVLGIRLVNVKIAENAKV